MAFGLQVPQRIFRGLDLRRREASGGDEYARAFTNCRVNQPGSFEKREGFSRIIDRRFPASVSTIIPAFYCFNLKHWIIHVDDFAQVGGNTGELILQPPPEKFLPGPNPNDPPPQGLVPEVTNLNVVVNAAVTTATLTWDNPKFKWLSGNLILRSEINEPVNFKDPNSIEIFFGAPITTFVDNNNIARLKDINLSYFYKVFTFVIFR